MQQACTSIADCLFLLLNYLRNDGMRCCTLCTTSCVKRSILSAVPRHTSVTGYQPHDGTSRAYNACSCSAFFCTRFDNET